MNRQLPYPVPDANAIANSDSYAYNQLQQMPDQRMQQNLAMNNFLGRRDSILAEQGNSYISRTQWDRDALAKGQHPGPILSHPYSDAIRGGHADWSLYPEHISDSKVDGDNEANNKASCHSYEQDMEIGYEDTPSPITLEVLEKKFQDEILKLVKEQNDAEYAELMRHKEAIIEINNKYQEKLSALRAQQTSRREEFLQKESEARLRQYQLAGTSHSLTRMGRNDLRDYAGPTISHIHRAYPPDQLNNLGKPQFRGEDRSRGTGGRIPYPEGRVYNNAGPSYY